MKKLFTIGFTEKRASDFFGLLMKAKIATLIDVRLNKTSQLSGFAKKEDLRFFLKEICDIEYIEFPELAPEPSMLKQYQKKEISWDRYADQYLNLISRRGVDKSVSVESVVNGCFLCSEHLPHQCHRKLAADYLNTCWGGPLQISHLVK